MWELFSSVGEREYVQRKGFCSALGIASWREGSDCVRLMFGVEHYWREKCEVQCRYHQRRTHGMLAHWRSSGRAFHDSWAHSSILNSARQYSKTYFNFSSKMQHSVDPLLVRRWVKFKEVPWSSLWLSRVQACDVRGSAKAFRNAAYGHAALPSSLIVTAWQLFCPDKHNAK